jgi:hypothetical protein
MTAAALSLFVLLAVAAVVGRLIVAVAHEAVDLMLDGRRDPQVWDDEASA